MTKKKLKAKGTKGDHQVREKFSGKGALAKKAPEPVATTAEQGTRFFKSVAQEVATAIEQGTVGFLYNDLSTWKDGFAKLHALANAAGKQQVIDHGVPKGEKGSKVLKVGDLMWEARIAKSGYDAKKYEALLRAKFVPHANAFLGDDQEDFLAKYMKARIVYEMDDEHTQRAIADKVLTPEELEACRVAPSYALQRPKKAEEFDIVDAEENNNE